MSARKPQLGFIFVTLFLDILGIGLIVPVLPSLVEQFTGNDIESASTIYGAMVAVYALMQFVFAPLLGSLSDQYGRRPIILISLFGAGVDYILLALAPTLAWLFIGRVIAGITAANITAATAYIVDVSPPEQRARNFGLIGAAFGVGFVLGPAVGGLLGDFGLRVPFFVVAGITLLNWLYGYFVLPESLAPENRRKFSWRRANPIGSLQGLRKYPLVFALASTIFLTGLAENSLRSVWVLYTDFRYGWGPLEVGLSLAVIGLTFGAVQGGLVGQFVSRFGERKTLLFGLALGAAINALYGWAPTGFALYSVIIVGSLSAVAQPAAQSLITKVVRDDEQGAVQGAITSVISLTAVIGPLVATNIFRYFISDAAPILLPGAPFFLGALFICGGMFLAVNTFRRFPDLSIEEKKPIDESTSGSTS